MAEKIVSERINVPFEEIKEDEEETEDEQEEDNEENENEDEKNLEESIVPEEPDSFIDFTTETVIPTLQASEIVDTTANQEPLEQELRNIPAQRQERTERAYEVTNMPDYGREYERQQEEAEQRKIEIRDTRRILDREEMISPLRPQETMAREREREEKTVMDYKQARITAEEERRLPFRRRREKGL